jgi:hypothetical protein
MSKNVVYTTEKSDSRFEESTQWGKCLAKNLNLNSTPDSVSAYY